MKKLFLLLPFFLLNACHSNSDTLRGNSYQFEINETPVLISFDKKDNRYYGKVVNNYFGSYSKDGNNITLHEGGATMMMGPKTKMLAEQEWFKLIPQISSFEQTQNGIIFTLKNGKKLTLQKTKTSH